MTQDAIVEADELIKELLALANDYDAACRAERIDADLLHIMTLPLDLASAGFTCMVSRPEREWTVELSRRIDGHKWKVTAKAETYEEVFASLYRVSRGSLRRLIKDAAPLEVAA